MRNGLMLRYAAEDDFGLPESAFLACQFWYIDALASIGRADEARELFDELLKRAKYVRNAERGSASRNGPTVGQPSTNVFDGGTDQFRNDAVAAMGRRMVGIGGGKARYH